MVTFCIAYFVPMRCHIGFRNGHCLKPTFSIIFGSNAAIDLILVSKCMFCEGKFYMATSCIVYLYRLANILDFKMATI